MCMAINHWESITVHPEQPRCPTDVAASERVSESLDEGVEALAPIWTEVPSCAHDHVS